MESEAEELRKYVEKYRRNLEGLSKEEREGKYKTAMDKLFLSILNLANTVYTQDIRHLVTSFLSDEEKKELRAIADKAAPLLVAALRKGDYDKFEEEREKLSKTYTDTYFDMVLKEVTV